MAGSGRLVELVQRQECPHEPAGGLRAHARELEQRKYPLGGSTPNVRG